MPGGCGRPDDRGNLRYREATDTHPCFNEPAHHTFARMHLPVAPRCNIRCNYCSRLYDCPNESRPGVTSKVLTPQQALDHVGRTLDRLSNLAVVGVAGPGDPLANPETLQTLGLVHQEYPHLTLCISTNGLLLADMLDDLASMNVYHVSVTVNAVRPSVGSLVYHAVRYRGATMRGEEAAELLAERQLDGIEAALKRGFTVKVNCVMIPEVNDEHLVEVARVVGTLGVHSVNVMPLIPVAGTALSGMVAPSRNALRGIQDMCEPSVKQMRHCRQCRSDAIGLLGKDLPPLFLESDTRPVDRCGTMEAALVSAGTPIRDKIG